MTVESDWSSASYFFSLVALSETASITLVVKRNKFARRFRFGGNLQTDGVDSRFENNSLTLTKDINFKPETLNLELNNTQISHKLLVTCLG
jgi:3-phosphoshikimate 1-carboxyvinyltransferase